MNNYPMDDAWNLWQKGEYPGHHLWGVTHLSHYGIDVEIFPYQTSKLLHKLGRKIGLGDNLDQQLRLLFSRTDYDLIYSACQTNTFLLALLRSLRLFRKPIVALVHHPFDTGKLKDRLFLHGHDRLLCLSAKARLPFVQEPDCYKKMDLIEWGADLAFYDVMPDAERLEADRLKTLSDASKPPFIVSAGKTERDHDTLVKAFLTINYPLKLYCSATTTPTVPHLPDHIEVNASDSPHNAVSYRTLLASYRQAYAIAIPLTKTHHLAGLTSLLDAMAVGKPVIMTHNHQIDLDIEKEGIGFWVEPGDVQGWQQATTYLLDHPDEARAMGDRGRYLCEKKYNLALFTATLAKTLRCIPLTSSPVSASSPVS